MTAPSVSTARAVRDAAKARMTRTASRVGHKLNPRSVAQEAVDGARERAVAVADDVSAAVRERPAIFAMGAALLAAIVAGRWWRRSRRQRDATPTAADSYPADPAMRPVKGPER